MVDEYERVELAGRRRSGQNAFLTVLNKTTYYLFKQNWKDGFTYLTNGN